MIPTLTADASGVLRINNIPVAEHPAPIFTYVFNTAGILLGALPTMNTWEWKPCVIQSDKEMQDFFKKHGSMHIAVTFVPDKFAQMIAKIGYSYAVAELGLGSFSPLALNIILTREKNVGHLIGGSLDAEMPIPDAGHLLALEFRPCDQGAIIIAEVRLFASIASPTYHAVVGLLHGNDQLSSMPDHARHGNTLGSAVMFAHSVPKCIKAS